MYAVSSDNKKTAQEQCGINSHNMMEKKLNHEIIANCIKLEGRFYPVVSVKTHTVEPV